MYDYLIVGSGLFGSVFARLMTDKGKKCIIIEKRGHIGGNCYSYKDSGIEVHKYGPHVFHTDSKKAWDFVNKYSEFNQFVNNIKVKYNNEMYSLPINMNTFYELWKIDSPNEARELLNKKRVKIKNPKNLEEWVLSQVGEEIYYKIFYGYTKKQWGVEPKTLNYNIAKRIPIRFEFNNNYYYSKYQGIPSNGYTDMFEKILDGIKVVLNTDFDKKVNKKIYRKVVYSGSIDELFDYRYGELGWRSHRFVHSKLIGDYQGNPIINYSSEAEAYTRIIEHKFFNPDTVKNKTTIITKEYPEAWYRGKEKMYPINNKRNKELYDKYVEKISDNFIIGGRCGSYRYLDMDKTILSAMKAVENELL